MRIRWLPETRNDLDRINEFWISIDPSLDPRAADVVLRDRVIGDDVLVLQVCHSRDQQV